MRRATQYNATWTLSNHISIHALLAESDLGNVEVGLPISIFYPRSRCVVRRFSSGAMADSVSFLSTLSLRRATPRPPKKHQWPDISIHALLAESDARPWPGAADAWISIHALLAESDGFYADMMALTAISIHALLAESDLAVLHVRGHHLRFLSTLSLRRATVLVWCSSGGVSDFYPRSPCGERHSGYDGLSKVTVFLSTLSLRRATPAI